LNGTDPEIGKESMEKLLEAMDKNFEVPKRETEKPFLMSIDSSINVSGRGTVATGTIE
jgi:elongation factor Tu